MKSKIVKVGYGKVKKVEIGFGKKLTFIGGPCAIKVLSYFTWLKKLKNL